VAAVPARTKGDKESVRRAILDAATSLVREVGASFTTQDLIKRADVALQTFYRHFGGKDQLMLALLDTQIRMFATQLGEAGLAIDDPVERLHHYVHTVLDHSLRSSGSTPSFVTSEHWRLHQLYPDEVTAATQAFADLLQRDIEAGVRAGQLSVDDPARTAWIIGTLVMGAYHHYAFHPGDPSIASVADDIWRFCITALGGPAPAKPVRRPRPPR
jgi:AcrR family transcriptional regulator